MPVRRVPLAKRLAGAALGRLISVDQAAKLLGVDKGSIRAWMGDHPGGDDWATLSELAGAQLTERLARGEIRDPRTLAVVKGVADRNVRYSTLIARREQRRAAEQAEPEPTPDLAWRAAFDQLDEPRASLMGAQMRRDVLDRRERQEAGAAQEPEPEEDDAAWHQRMLEWVERTAALSDHEVRDQLLALEPGWERHYWPPRRVLMDAIDSLDDPPEAPEPVPTAQEPPVPPQSPPGASQRLVAPSERGPAPPYGLHVVSDAERNDPNDYGHPSWKRADR